MYILMAVFCALCVFFDMKNDRIPNPLTAVFFVAAVILRIIGKGTEDIPWLLMDTAAVFAATLILFGFKALRGGDGKMMCVVSAMCGMKAAFMILFLAMAIGSLAGLVKKSSIREKNNGTDIYSFQYSCFHFNRLISYVSFAPYIMI